MCAIVDLDAKRSEKKSSPTSISTLFKKKKKKLQSPPKTTPIDYSSMTLKTPSQSSSSSSSSSSDLNLTVSPSFSNYVFGPVPSKSEVDFAISVLQNFVLAVSSNREESKWVVQILESPTSKLLVSYGLKRLYDAIHLWQIDPFVQRLVASLASDRAVWDAIMNNDLVRDLGKPLRLVGNASGNSASKEPVSGTGNCTSEDAEFAAMILQRIWESTKAKVAELVEKFQSLMSKMFQKRDIEKLSCKDDGDEEQLKHKVESSLLLSVIIILIVLVVRAGGV